MNAKSIGIASLLLMAGCTKTVDETKVTASCKEPCEISLQQLAGAPERFEGKEISVVGYLGIFNHVLALYPTETNYRVIDVSSSVGFRVAASEQLAFVDKGLYEYVRVKGVFSNRFHGFDAKRLGDFTAVSAMSVVTPIKDVDREKDFGVEVQFLDN